MVEKRSKVVVFGIFDGVHEGHRSLFRQARAYGDELIAIVGRDSVALRLKGKMPTYSQDQRVEFLRAEALVDGAVLGDEEISSYAVLRELNPDVVCLGYDQETLEQDLKNWLQTHHRLIEFHRLEPYHPSLYHNSVLRN